MDELYALTDPELAAQAEAVKADFKGWLASNFTLTTPQTDYLNGMADAAIDHLGMQSGFCFLHQLPITLSISGSPGPGMVKWVETEEETTTETNATGDFIVTGQLWVTFKYVL